MTTFNSDRLVEQVTIKASLAPGDFTDQEILDLASDCLMTELVPLIVSLREDYFVRNASQAITQSQSHYPIPARASGMTLRDIKIVRGTRLLPIYQIGREAVSTTEEGTPSSFYKEDNSVVLYPTPNRTEDTLKLSYFVRPPSLVPVSECGRIATIDTNTNTITGSFPSTWLNTDTFDLIKGSGGFEHREINLVANSVSTSSITLTSPIPSTLQVGDYICLAEQSCFPMIPQESHNLLVQMTVAAVLESKGDREGLAVAKGRSDQMAQAMRSLMTDRIESTPQRFKSQLI